MPHALAVGPGIKTWMPILYENPHEVGADRIVRRLPDGWRHVLGERGIRFAFVRDRLAHFKAPKQVTFGPLPKTSTGKIQKFQLRERAKSASAIE